MFRTESVSRLRRTQSGTDAYDDPIYTETTTVLTGAMFAPGGIVEPVEPGRAPVVSEPTLYWRKQWPDVQPSDRFIVRGKVYDVVGDSAEWRGYRAGGLVVNLRRAEEGVA